MLRHARRKHRKRPTSRSRSSASRLVLGVLGGIAVAVIASLVAEPTSARIEA
jgi:hypothetical protein